MADLFDYDAEMRRYNGHFRAATGVGPGDRVLDVGCGAGQSTRDAARAAAPAGALGVDVSDRMLDLARRRAAEEGVHNVRFELADAQRHPFPGNHFDLAISRFGTMFFTEPVAAFANLARALRPGGRLIMLVWQESARQEWVTALRDAIAAGPAPVEESPFSLADPAAVSAILDAAGFTSVGHTDLDEPVYYGKDAAGALDAVRTLRMTQDLLAGQADRERALERLRAALAGHETADGVWFDSRARIITAHRR